MDMNRSFKMNIYSQGSISHAFKQARFILLFLLLALAGCQKDSLATRVLQPGTKCNIYDGVFAPGDIQPAQPVTVVSVYRTAASGLIYYNVTDNNGEIWQMPDN